ncbi:hypothetical protein HB852_09975 [Listeria grandensis]|uniref:hypothetical protein n=1 Tax=Listeria grandensis TaxID=1494963 RepID=UPI0016280FD9|nr:hypothetical protein [Listeria grandensis]MBC1474945.1 hypothetical protein [Listeria grandensis]
MKTSEFKKAVEALRFDLGHSGDGTTIDMFMVYDEDSHHVGSVYTKHKYGMRICFDAVEELGEKKAHKLAELLFEYASTPLDEREEPKKWYIKCPITGEYLNVDKTNQNEMTWSDFSEVGHYKTKFTRAEIDAFEFEHAHLIEDEVKIDE